MNGKTKTFGIIAIICAAIAVTFLTNIPTWLKYKNNEITDLNSETLVLTKGDIIECDADYVLGAAAEEYSTNFGVRTSDSSSKLYYVLWLDNNKYALYETGNKDQYATLDKITDETFAFFESQAAYQESGDVEDLKLPTTKLHITGRVVNMSSEIQGYFREWYNQAFVDNEFDSCTETVMITNAAFDRLGVTVIIGAVGAVLALLFLALTVISFIKGKQGSEYGY
jgi:hypothetical protein